MFHHFKGGKHIDGQGAISQDQFQQIIDYLRLNYNLIGANEFSYKVENNLLKTEDVVLSFDDGLKCQYDLALDVLDQNNIDAYFFIYTGMLDGVGIELEVYRDFRSRSFHDFDDFFQLFFRMTSDIFNKEKMTTIKLCASNFLKEHSLYTENDRIYRFIRDKVLTKVQYEEILNSMMVSKGYRIENYVQNLFMTEDNILDLSNCGHLIGLHSYSHPTMIHELSHTQQEYEYSKNMEKLSEICGVKIKSMSHPCGRYADHTLEVLKKLGITVGFCSLMSKNQSKTVLELPRNDHMNVYRETLL